MEGEEQYNIMHVENLLGVILKTFKLFINNYNNRI